MLRRALGRLCWLRYLLLWPLISAYRRRARRSLRWRLAGYNLATLLAGLATALCLVGLLAAAGASARDYAAEEPADDARVAAEFLVASGLIGPDGKADDPALPRVLDALASGELPLYRGPRANQFDVRPRTFLQGVQGVALISESEGPIIASARYSGIGSGAAEPIFQAFGGSTDLRTNSAFETVGTAAGAGAYPVKSPDGHVRLVVVVEKSEIRAPRGWAVVRAEIRPVVGSVWVGSVVAAIPGLVVAVLLAVAAARSVGGRIRDLAGTAESLADGSLDSRVAVRGEDEVASLGRSFNTMADRLQATMGSLAEERERAVGLLDTNRQLVADVSHELRTPVALIRGQVEALDEDFPGNQRAAMALREIDRLDQLVTDLFVLATAEAAPMESEETDLAELLRRAVEPLVTPALRDAKVTVLLETHERETTVRVTPERLVAVVQNLLRNAVRHTPEGGLVRVALSEDNGWAEIEVSDTGAGIPPADLPHIFERFYRGDPSRSRATGGAGLGLAIAHEFVEAMGGSIRVESPPGEGATFVVRLPICG